MYNNIRAAFNTLMLVFQYSKISLYPSSIIIYTNVCINMANTVSFLQNVAYLAKL